MKVCIKFRDTAAGQRELGYAADFVRRSGAQELYVYIEQDTQVVKAVATDDLLHSALLHRRCMVTACVGEVARLLPHQVQVVEVVDWDNLSYPSGDVVVVGQEFQCRRTPPGTSMLVPFYERTLAASGGPLVFPFGNRDTGLRAARLGLRIAGAMNREAVFYHTTWPRAGVSSTEPREHLCPGAVDVCAKLEALAAGSGVKHRTVLEMAPDVTKGILDCAGRELAGLIVVAYGRWKGGTGGGSGSYVDRILHRTAIPTLIVREEVKA